MVGPAGVLLFLTMPVAVFLWVVFSVAWHRQFLMPSESVTVGAALKWSRRQSRFLLLSIVIGLLILLVMVGGALAAFAASVLFGLGQEGMANQIFLPLYLGGRQKRQTSWTWRPGSTRSWTRCARTSTRTAAR